MTSQRSTERPARSEGRRATSRRGLKKRGLLPSFGDIVLPVVSIAAIVLLVLAGRQFFINGMKTSPGITSTRAYADSPAIIAEREAKPEPKPEPEVKEVKAPPIQVIAVTETPQLPPAVEEKPVVVQSTPKPTPKPAPAKPSQPKAAPKKAVQPASNLPANKQWRVQTGAYTTKSGAEEAAKKIRNAGYKASVYHNPASKHVKVWVLGGATKAQADKVVAEMKKMGYKSSFAFPPSK